MCKEKIKIHYRTKLCEEALNRNHRVYDVRLLQLQHVMATHEQKSGKNLEFWIQNSEQTLKREIELQILLSDPSFFHISCVECCVPH